jgi:hypothetical protein
MRADPKNAEPELLIGRGRQINRLRAARPRRGRSIK